MANKNKGRIGRTIAFFEKREAFMNLLVLELQKQLDKAHSDGFDFATRLNGTSDIRWESVRFTVWPWVQERVGRKASGKVTILELFGDVQFYDYTKLHNRKGVPSNYHLTFSLNETNREFATGQPHNIAVVFAGKLPDTYLGREVIDGDEHDYRPQDPDNVVVGLKVKGQGRQDDTGFVVQL